MKRLIGLLVFCSGVAFANTQTLSKAWDEYEFQSFDTAYKLFNDLSLSSDDKSLQNQAKLGLAMVQHHREKGRKVSEAWAGYEALIASDADDTIKSMAKLFLGTLAIEKNDLAKGNELLEMVIHTDPGSILSQDALLRRTLYNMGNYDDEKSASAIAYLEAQLANIPEETEISFRPIFNYLLGVYYFWNGDREKAVQAYQYSSR